MVRRWKEWSRALRWRLSWYRRSTEITYSPYYRNVEPTNCCNLRCSICSMDDSRPRGYMSSELYKQLIRQAAKMGVTEIRLFLAGEPLLHPEIAGMVRLAEEQGLRSCIHTNATRLTEELGRELIEAGLREISFSFDGETPEEYERIRVGADFHATLSHIVRFLHTKKAMASRQPRTILQVIKLFDQDSCDAPALGAAFRDRFRGLPLDDFLVLYPHTWAGERADIAARPMGTYYFPCQAPWQSMSVAWDGRVLLCCGDLNGRVVLGDLKTEPAAAIWRGKRMRELRRALVEHREDDLAMCGRCDALWRRAHPLIVDAANTRLGRHAVSVVRTGKRMMREVAVSGRRGGS